jgi:hypothetical protein
MTRAQLIESINASTRTFLGNDSGVYGTLNMSKPRLETMDAAYKRMAELKQEARRLRAAYSGDQLLVFALVGDEPDAIQQAHDLERQANDIWHTKF